MRNLRVLTIGLISSWIVLQLIYVPFTQYFLKHSKLYAFSIALELNDALFHTLTTSILVASAILLSISIGMSIAVFIYHPVESVCAEKLKHNANQQSAIDM